MIPQHHSHSALRAVLFDMDGTLTNTEEVWADALHQVAVDLGGRLSAATRAQMLGRPLGEVITMLHAETGARADAAVTRRALLATVEARLRDGVPWLPGARELLHAVRRAGLRTALVTSSPRRLVNIALNTLGHDSFETTVSGDDVRRGKPDPEPYRQAMARLRLSPSQCLAVEDSAPGASAAERAGLPVLVVPSGTPVPVTDARTIAPSLTGQSVQSLHLMFSRHAARPAVHDVVA